MLREKNWQTIEEIAAQLHTCIRPGRYNHDAAKKDFDEGTVRYYSFPLNGSDQRGYLRVIPAEYDGRKLLILDYFLPFTRYFFETFKHFSRRMSKIYDVMIPSTIQSRYELPNSEYFGEIDLDRRQPKYSVFANTGEMFISRN